MPKLIPPCLSRLTRYSILPCVIFLLSPWAASAADLKIAVVDVDLAFESYHETRAAANAIEDERAKVRQEVQQHMVKLQELVNKYQTLVKEGSEVSDAQARAKYKEAQKVKEEAESLDRELNQLRERRERQLDTSMAQRREVLYKTIFDVVNQKAEGFDLVLDKSGAGLSRMPFILRMNREKIIDLTEDVVKELNKDAPPGFIPGARAVPPGLEGPDKEPGIPVAPAVPRDP